MREADDDVGLEVVEDRTKEKNRMSHREQKKERTEQVRVEDKKRDGRGGLSFIECTHSTQPKLEHNRQNREIYSRT